MVSKSLYIIGNRKVGMLRMLRVKVTLPTDIMTHFKLMRQSLVETFKTNA